MQGPPVVEKNLDDARRPTYHSPVRRRRSTANQRRIIDSATRLMSTRPLRQATMALIASDSGMSVESVYQLGTKQQLLVAALTTLEARFGELAEALRRSDELFSSDLHAIVDGVAGTLAVWDDETSCLWLNAATEAVRGGPVAGALRAITERRRDDVRAVAEQLGSRPDAELVVRELMVLTSAETYVQLRRDEDLSTTEHASWVAEEMRRILGIEAASASDLAVDAEEGR